MTDRIDVMLETECTDADITAVTQVFETAGIPADISAVYARRSAGPLPWVIIIGGGYIAWEFLKSAVQGAGDEAGRDGWRALMRLVTALYEARKDSRAEQGTVSIEPSEVQEILLPPDLPEEAYRKLWEIEEPHASMSGQLRWNDETQAWADALARTMRCDYPGCQDWATQTRAKHPGTPEWVRREFCDVHAAAADLGDPQAWT